jgi:UDP-glucose 4-epimerase
VVIVGSSGFIGAALMRRLQCPGYPPVKGFRSTTLDLTSADGAGRLGQEVDEKTLLIVTARARSCPDPLESLGDDIALGCNLARCLGRQRVKQCVYFSSTAVYGDAVTNRAIVEETPLAPTSPYGLGKVACEWVIRQAGQTSEIPVTILRPCLVYGPGDTSPPYGPGRFIQAIRRGEPVRVFGDGSEVRDYLFIDDLVEITLRLAWGGRHGTWNLATGGGYSFRTILDCLRSISRQDFKIVSQPRDRPKTDQQVDPSKLVRALPGLRFTPLEQGLARALPWSAG